MVCRHVSQNAVATVRQLDIFPILSGIYTAEAWRCHSAQLASRRHLTDSLTDQ